MSRRGSSSTVLQAVTNAAVSSTAAAAGWLLRQTGDELEVVAAAGEDIGDIIGLRVAAGTGSAGYVVASGQPLAVSAATSDQRFSEGVARAAGWTPIGVLCVPCGNDETVFGALELIDKHGESAFTLDDVEVATLLGGIAGAALADGDTSDAAVPAPGELAAELRALASAEPEHYRAVASVVSALLSRG